MTGFVRLLCFADGNVKRGDEGVYYNRDPTKMIRVGTDAKYEQLLDVIFTGLGINRGTPRVEITHRYPMLARKGGKLQYVLEPIKNDEDVVSLMDFTVEMGPNCCQQLLVMIYKRSVPLVEQEARPSNDTSAHKSQVCRSIKVGVAAHQNNSYPEQESCSSNQLDGDREAQNALKVVPMNVDQEVKRDGPNPVEAPNSPISRPSLYEQNGLPGASPRRKDVQLEDPVPFFKETMGDGYITFEEDLRLLFARDKWSCGDEFKKRK